MMGLPQQPVVSKKISKKKTHKNIHFLDNLKIINLMPDFNLFQLLLKLKEETKINKSLYYKLKILSHLKIFVFR
jgi:hypothetical protein